MYVRTATERDLDAIRALLVETWHDTYDAIYGPDRVTEITDSWHSLVALKERLRVPNSELVVADDGHEIAGMAFATTEDEGASVMLHQLYVRPRLQGRGVGTMLLEEIEGCFPGAERIRLEVEEANSGAVDYYIRQGFAKVGQTADCGMQGSGIPASIFERPIVWAG